MVEGGEAIVDIESNQSESREDARNEQMIGGKGVKNVLRSLGLTSSYKGLDEGESCSDSNRKLVKTGDDEFNDIESLIHEKFEGEKRGNTPVLGRTQSKERQKSKNLKRAPKPPRPRRGPSLSASDLRLVKEISELVMKKRARIERMKSLKKLRSARLQSTSSSGSSNMSLFAMMITVLFVIVIIYQGFGSRTTGLVSGHFDSKLPK